jgi:hypothetical protein
VESKVKAAGGKTWLASARAGGQQIERRERFEEFEEFER